MIYKTVFFYSFLCVSVLFSQNKRLVIDENTFRNASSKDLAKIYSASFVSVESFSLKDSSHIKKLNNIKVIEIPESDNELLSIQKKQNSSSFLEFIPKKNNVKEVHFYENIGVNPYLLQKFKNLNKVTVSTEGYREYNFNKFQSLKELNFILKDSVIVINSNVCEKISLTVCFDRAKITLNTPNVKGISLITPFQKPISSCYMICPYKFHLSKLSLFCEINSSFVIENLDKIDTLKINLNEGNSDFYINSTIKKYAMESNMKTLIVYGLNNSKLESLKSDLKKYNIKVYTK